MANTDDKPVLKITLEDLAKVELPVQAPAAAAAAPAMAGAKQYGNIAAETEGPAAAAEEKTPIYLQGWFYLGAAGLLGALTGWAIGEPFFIDGPDRTLGDTLRSRMIIPLVLVFMCFGFSIAESIVERSLRKAMRRAALSLPLGLVLAIAFMIAGDLVYGIGIRLCIGLGVDPTTAEGYNNPAMWLARSAGWMVFAAAAGIVYGLVDRSAQKGKYGVWGAVIGGGIGGAVFNPINMATGSGGPSRAIGFALIGLAAGVAIGIVESAFKDRWLYAAAGPLAGKQFILYKPLTTLGSSQSCDIYMFKDSSILPQHGVIEMRGAQTFLRTNGPIFVSGAPVRMRALASGDVIQIGRYVFHFHERHRNG